MHVLVILVYNSYSMCLLNENNRFLVHFGHQNLLTCYIMRIAYVFLNFLCMMLCTSLKEIGAILNLSECVIFFNIVKLMLVNCSFCLCFTPEYFSVKHMKCHSQNIILNV